MNRKNISINFDFEIKEISDLNKSFSLARVAIAYAGRNRNMSSISKTAFENALQTLKNVPVVGRYDETENSFGGHDIKVVHDKDEVKVVNATTPFGVVPESADQYWESVIEKDGTIRDYLFTDIILWKRQYGYEYLVKKKSIGQSMEISFSNYVIDQDGYCVIEDFEFEALCLIDCTPCFESASVQLFSNKEISNYKSQFSAMIEDLKDLMQEQSIKLDFSIDINKEGGKEILSKEKMAEILAEYKLTIEDIDFEVTEDILEEDFKEKIESFLQDNIDKKNEVVEEKTEDKKDESDEEYVLKSEFESLNVSYEELKEEFENYKKEYSTHNSVVKELEDFKKEKITLEHKANIENVLSEFSDLNNIDEFKALSDKAMNYEDIEELIKDCYAIRGKNIKINFSENESDFKKAPLNTINFDVNDDGFGGLLNKVYKEKQ